MSDIPFLNPTILNHLDLPIPSRDITPQLLPPFNLNRRDEPPIDLQSYRKLYAFALRRCNDWRGYVQMRWFKLHVQVSEPNPEDTRFDTIEGTAFLLHGYLERSGT